MLYEMPSIANIAFSFILFHLLFVSGLQLQIEFKIILNLNNQEFNLTSVSLT